MSLDYYLFCKKTYHEIQFKLDEIINKYNDIQQFMMNHEIQKNNIIILEEEDKFFFIEAKKYIENIENKFKEKIQTLCNHKMVDDSIDITPDLSTNIRYCELCEYTETK